MPLGKTTFQDTSSLAVLDGDDPVASRSTGRIAAAFVTVKPARRTVGSTTLKVENHLPFTLQSVSGQGRQFGRRADGAVRGRRRRPGPLGAPADPGGHGTDRAGGAQRALRRPIAPMGATDSRTTSGLRRSSDPAGVGRESGAVPATCGRKPARLAIHDDARDPVPETLAAICRQPLR